MPYTSPDRHAVARQRAVARPPGGAAGGRARGAIRAAPGAARESSARLRRAGGWRAMVASPRVWVRRGRIARPSTVSLFSACCRSGA